jgi:4'-phosphopantetheinyl transferase
MAESIILSSEVVHVWAAPLTAGPDRLESLLQMLTPDERQRAARFLPAAIHARTEFVVARATLRQLLSRYINDHPSEHRFVIGNNGKPALAGRELFFNVSHTRGLAVYAFTRRGEVGIDVEQLRPRTTLLDMAARFFAPGEVAAIHALPPEHREEAFFHVWTRKEAFIKAVGQGLAFGLERFEVSVPPDDPARVRHVDGDAGAGAAWSLTALTPGPGYVGALAIQGEPPRIEMRVVEATGRG